MEDLTSVSDTSVEGSWGTQKEHYAMRLGKAMVKIIEILDIVFGVYTANAIGLSGRIAAL